MKIYALIILNLLVAAYASHMVELTMILAGHLAGFVSVWGFQAMAGRTKWDTR